MTVLLVRYPARVPA